MHAGRSTGVHVCKTTEKYQCINSHKVHAALLVFTLFLMYWNLLTRQCQRSRILLLLFKLQASGWFRVQQAKSMRHLGASSSTPGSLTELEWSLLQSPYLKYIVTFWVIYWQLHRQIACLHIRPWASMLLFASKHQIKKNPSSALIISPWDAQHGLWDCHVWPPQPP